MSELAGRRDGKVPVSIYFIRPNDGRLYRQLDWLTIDEIRIREKSCNFCLETWGGLTISEDITFVMLIAGHQPPLVSAEILRQYVNRAFDESPKEAA